MGFINEKLAEPQTAAQHYFSWSGCNDMVTSWLLNSLSKDIAHSVIYSRTAKDLWTDLEQRFRQSNGAKLYHLQKEMTGLVQRSSDVAGYYTKLKLLWDELDSLKSDMGCNCVCVCNGKHKMVKSVEDQRLIQFLMGLNDVYGAARGNQNMAQQRFGNQTQRFGYPTTNQPKGGNQYQGQRVNTQRANQGQKWTRGRKKKFNPNVTCSYCLKVGHIENDCYRLNGYPKDFQFTNTNTTHNKGVQDLVRGNAAMTEEDFGSMRIEKE